MGRCMSEQRHWVFRHVSSKVVFITVWSDVAFEKYPTPSSNWVQLASHRNHDGLEAAVNRYKLLHYGRVADDVVC